MLCIFPKYPFCYCYIAVRTEWLYVVIILLLLYCYSHRMVSVLNLLVPYCYSHRIVCPNLLLLLRLTENGVCYNSVTAILWWCQLFWCKAEKIVDLPFSSNLSIFIPKAHIHHKYNYRAQQCAHDTAWDNMQCNSWTSHTLGAALFKFIKCR